MSKASAIRTAFASFFFNKVIIIIIIIIIILIIIIIIIIITIFNHETLTRVIFREVLDYLKGVQKKFSRCHTDSTIYMY